MSDGQYPWDVSTPNWTNPLLPSLNQVYLDFDACRRLES